VSARASHSSVLRTLARLLLAAALLVAWQAALQHPIEHVDELGELVHVHDGHAHDGDREPGSLCDLLAALTACAAGQSSVLCPVPCRYATLSFPAPAPRVADAPPFFSQGPPASV
jgi:hypothetical protein